MFEQNEAMDQVKSLHAEASEEELTWDLFC